MSFKRSPWDGRFQVAFWLTVALIAVWLFAGTPGVK